MEENSLAQLPPNSQSSTMVAVPQTTNDPQLQRSAPDPSPENSQPVHPDNFHPSKSNGLKMRPSIYTLALKPTISTTEEDLHPNSSSDSPVTNSPVKHRAKLDVELGATSLEDTSPSDLLGTNYGPGSFTIVS